MRRPLSNKHERESNEVSVIYLSAREVAAQLGMSVHFVYRLVRHSKIECHRVGRCVRFTQAQVEAYLDRCRVPVRDVDDPLPTNGLIAKHLGL